MMSHQLRASGAAHMDTKSEVNGGRGAAPRTFHSNVLEVFTCLSGNGEVRPFGNGTVTKTCGKS